MATKQATQEAGRTKAAIGRAIKRARGDRLRTNTVMPRERHHHKASGFIQGVTELYRRRHRSINDRSLGKAWWPSLQRKCAAYFAKQQRRAHTSSGDCDGCLLPRIRTAAAPPVKHCARHRQCASTEGSARGGPPNGLHSRTRRRATRTDLPPPRHSPGERPCPLTGSSALGSTFVTLLRPFTTALPESALGLQPRLISTQTRQGSAKESTCGWPRKPRASPDARVIGATRFGPEKILLCVTSREQPSGMDTDRLNGLRGI